MDLSTWLDGDRGRAKALSEHFKVTGAAITHWRTKGVPADRMRAVHDFTGGAVTLEDLVPPSRLPAEQPEG